MRISLSATSSILAIALLFSSCATTKYSDDVNQNNYYNLEAGRIYSFKLKNSTQRQKMVFNSVNSDSIIGFKSRQDSSRIALAKSNVTEVKDVRKATMTTGAVAIGTLGAAAIILSSTRATKNE